MRQVDTYHICILGSESAGKTCFIAGLAVQAESNRKSPFQILGTDRSSQTYLYELKTTLYNQTWPPSTHDTSLLRLNVRFRERPIQLQMLDYPGEDFRKALNQLDYDHAEEFRQYMLSADVLVLLLDPAIDLDTTSNLNVSEAARRKARQSSLHNSIMEISRERRRQSKPFPDIAVVLSKCDEHPDLKDSKSAEKYFHSVGQELWNKLNSWGSVIRCFPVSAVGITEEVPDLSESTEVRRIPAKDLQPSGYEALFDWILARPKRRQRRLWQYAGYATVVLIAVVFIGWYLLVWSTIDQIEDPNTRIGQIIESDYRIPWPSSYIRALDERVDSELVEIENQLMRTHALAEIDELLKDLDRLGQLQNFSRGLEIEDLQERGITRLHELFHKKVKESFTLLSPTFPEQANKFLARFPEGNDSDQVRSWCDEYGRMMQCRDRQAVQIISPNEPGFLDKKAKATIEYTQKHPDEPNAPQMRDAAALARELATSRAYLVRIESFGTLSSPDEHAVLIYRHNGSDPVKIASSTGSTTRSSWGDEGRFQIDWTPGTELRVVLRHDGWLDEDVAWVSDSELLSLKLLSGKRELMNIKESWREEFSQGAPYVKFRLARPGRGDDYFRDTDWQLLNEWIYPGNKWQCN